MESPPLNLFCDSMGFLNEGEEWQHINEEEAKGYINLFRTYHAETGAKWHRYVHAEHIKGIAEIGNGNYFFLRSIFRSVVQFTFIGRIAAMHWWYGYVFELNQETDELELVADSSTLTDTEYRELYRSCGGSSNF